MTNKQIIRSLSLAKRRQLTAHEQDAYSAQIGASLIQNIHWQGAHTIVLYNNTPDEVQTQALITAAWRSQKNCYLPCLSPEPESGLAFRLHQASKPLISNRYGILEPAPEQRSIAVTDVDLLVIPLVAFDIRGNRLGMGKGYYDRALSIGKEGNKPWLVGLAYACQQVDAVPVDTWDVPLDLIITEQKIYTPLPT
jgi:5-formyltetrahydrofolate cyclo-ligase